MHKIFFYFLLAVIFASPLRAQEINTKLTKVKFNEQGFYTSMKVDEDFGLS